VPWIERATEQMSKNKVDGTPTVIIDGKQVNGPPDASGRPTMPTIIDIQEAIEAARK
jgi:protein-disulfide isomerase